MRILEGELAHIKANAAFFGGMADISNNLAWATDASGAARNMANPLQTIAASSKDLLHQIIGSLSRVRAKTLAAITEAGKGTSLKSARNSAVASNAAKVRRAREREKQAAPAKGKAEERAVVVPGHGDSVFRRGLPSQEGDCHGYSASPSAWIRTD